MAECKVLFVTHPLTQRVAIDTIFAPSCHTDVIFVGHTQSADDLIHRHRLRLRWSEKKTSEKRRHLTGVV